MEYRKVLLDSSIIIDHLRKKDKSKSILYRITNKFELFISSITVFELYAGAIDELKQKDIEIILNYINVIPFDLETAKKSGAIYIYLKKKNKVIEIRDIFIATTSILNNLPLITLNVSHFEKIDEINILKVEDKM